MYAINNNVPDQNTSDIDIKVKLIYSIQCLFNKNNCKQVELLGLAFLQQACPDGWQE